MAYAAYQQETPKIATTHAEHVWQAWQESPAWADRANLKLYWMLGLVWKGLKDSRFKVVRKKAKILLRERSEKIEDEEANWAEAEKKFQAAYYLWDKRGKTENSMKALAGLAYAAYQQKSKATSASRAEHLWQA